MISATYQADPITIYNREIDHFSGIHSKWASIEIFNICENIKI